MKTCASCKWASNQNCLHPANMNGRTNESCKWNRTVNGNCWGGINWEPRQETSITDKLKRFFHAD